MRIAGISGARFCIRASPHGTRSGFAVLPDGADGRVTVTVLPKPWSSGNGVAREFVHEPGSTTHVVLYETEQATVETEVYSVGALAMSLADLGHDQPDLLAQVAPPDAPAVPTAVPIDPFGDLIDLMLLADRGRLINSQLDFEGSFAPSLLRLLTRERLLKVVERLIFRARPRYAERSEVLEVPRGRLSERSLLFSMATGTPRVESHFDELTMDTPMLQIVASALRVVASERLPPKISTLRPSLQNRAVHLLRYFSGVSLVDRERALLAADRMWISPLDSIWEPAIDAALPVLRDRAVVPDGDAESSKAILIHVFTEKFWEQCLDLALETAFETVAVSRDAHLGGGVSVPAPWAPKTHTEVELAAEAFPDFMFRVARRVAVADAKYKLGRGGAPSSADGYQLFAYSHLAKLDGRQSDLAVIFYPTRAGGQARQIELERLHDRNYPLWLVRLPFPTRLDLQSQNNWGIYVARLACTIRDASDDWMIRLNE